MLIQNTSNMTQAPQPARLASDGAPVAVAAMPEAPLVATPAVGQKPSAVQLQSALDNINKALKQANKNLEFSVDENTKKSVVKLVDTETGDVVRQFPSEEALAISRSIERFQHGLLLKQEA
ncbi:MAG TPA: flagellar protein FlaG [Gallionella sp.]|nr:flagellar protein FlaG [Gallionella sp.]